MRIHELRGIVALLALLYSSFLCVSQANAKECIDCHSEIMKQFKSNSHHIQGTNLSGKHCYACHWEATPEGLINAQYHVDISAKASAKTKKREVHLVVWDQGKRPTVYKSASTAITYNIMSIGTQSERKDIAKLTTHCLGCHSDSANAVRPFSGDAGVPLKYAWDGQSVASRYSQKGVTVWGKYSTANTNKKQQVSKAFSAHGNAVANQGGWSPSSGYDKDIPNNRANVKNVECFDCHNSHGSSVSGATSSYRTFDGTLNGGILKETFAGKGGYQMNYKPSVNTYAKSNNPFNAGAGLCFDCHETARAGTTPWGYSSTFGAKQPIMGYKDSPGFGTGSKGSSSRFKNRQSREEIVSSHLKAGKALANPAQGQINGLCTPCHDPHGVSRTLNEKMAYAVPLLKGAWLTSPYREDGPPSSASGKDDIQKQSGSGQASGKEHSDYNAVNRGAGANFGKGSSDAARPADYNAVNRDAGANFGKGASGAARSDYNAVNRDAGANFGKGASDAARPADYNAVNRDAGANFGKGASGAARSDYNAVNRDAGANFGKGSSDAARPADYNAVNRDAGANFGKGASGAARSDYNAVNRDAGANFGKGSSDAARPADYNAVNRDAGANFGKGASGAARSDYNAVNRDAGANFGKGSSDAARPADYNAVNRDAGANFGKGVSSAPQQSDYNGTNRDASVNYGKGTSSAARGDSNTSNRDSGSNFAKGGSGAPREPMKGMKYNVDQNTFDGNNRIRENDDTFGGICLKCHAKENLVGESKSGQIHRTVKGWGDNKEHSFPCSKCHQSHNSGLPRLMQTNCFEQGPSGLRESSGVPWLPYKNVNGKPNAQNVQKSDAQGGSSSKSKVVGCHVKQFGKATATSSKNQENNQWKEVTSW